MVTGGAGDLGLPQPPHDALQDGGEGRHPDARADQNGVLRLKDVTAGRPVRTVHHHLGSGGHDVSQLTSGEMT